MGIKGEVLWVFIVERERGGKYGNFEMVERKRLGR